MTRSMLIVCAVLTAGCVKVGGGVASLCDPAIESDPEISYCVEPATSRSIILFTFSSLPSVTGTGVSWNFFDLDPGSVHKVMNGDPSWTCVDAEDDDRGLVSFVIGDGDVGTDSQVLPFGDDGQDIVMFCVGRSVD